ncbi:MAG: hypothetical protein AAFZ87_12550 [Planctomycetota bacterium]
MEPNPTSDPVTRALLPALLHEINGATQLLVGLRAVLDLPQGEGMFAKRAPDLAETSERVHELGFAMAVLATASGADMLMARRERRGLHVLMDLARRAVSRVGGAPIEVRGETPLLRPDVLDGWQVPWAGAALVALVPGRIWTWEGSRLRGSAPEAGSAPPDDEVTRLVAVRCPGATLEADGGDVVWTLPGEWIAD